MFLPSILLFLLPTVHKSSVLHLPATGSVDKVQLKKCNFNCVAIRLHLLGTNILISQRLESFYCFISTTQEKTFLHLKPNFQSHSECQNDHLFLFVCYHINFLSLICKISQTASLKPIRNQACRLQSTIQKGKRKKATLQSNDAYLNTDDFFLERG